VLVLEGGVKASFVVYRGKRVVRSRFRDSGGWGGLTLRGGVFSTKALPGPESTGCFTTLEE
jgi:hypothetical protein